MYCEKRPHPVSPIVFIVGVAVFLTLPMAIAVGGPNEVEGSLDWPQQWRVFGPLRAWHPLPPKSVLKALPEDIEIDGEKFKAKTVKAVDNKLDFRKIYDKFEVKDTAYVFATVTAPRDGNVTLGMGADWWMQVWLDGKLVCDTTQHGNIAWPAAITNYTRTIRVTKGAHVFAVRFLSGKGSSLLALGGPDQLREIPPEKWQAAVQPNPENLGRETVANGNFEQRGRADAWLPEGWTNGQGAAAFTQAELVRDNTAPLGGSFSLRIDTLSSKARKRKICQRISVIPGLLYKISYKSRWQGGGYASISLRKAPDSALTYFLHGGLVDSKAQGEYKGYYYFENPRPYLVIEAHEPVQASVDDISIRITGDMSMKWRTYGQQRAPWGPEWHTLTDKVVTPHTKWAKPYAGGALRVLSMMPRWRQRWTVELAQRMSVKYDTVMFAKYNSLGGDSWVVDADGDPVLLRPLDDAVARLAKPLDCIVVSSLSAAAIKPAIIEAILKQVENGAGLVIMHQSGKWPASFKAYKKGPWAKAVNVENITDDQIEYVSLGPVTKTENEFYRYGRGRIVHLRKSMLTGDLARQFEFRTAYVMKAMLWAARRVSACRIESAGLPSEVARADLPLAFPVTFTSAAGANSELAMWVMDRHGDTIHTEHVKLSGAQSHVTAHLSKLKGGEHYVNLQLKTNGVVEDWTTTMLHVTSDPAIQRINLTMGRTPYYMLGDKIKGTIVLSAALGEGQKVRLTLTDADALLWRTVELPGRGPRIDFALDTDHLSVLVHHLRAEIMEGGEVVDDVHEEVVVAKPNDWYRKNFDFQLWQGAGGYLGSLLYGVLRREYDITSNLWSSRISEEQARICGWSNMRIIPGGMIWYPSRSNKAVGDRSAPSRVPCLSSPEYRAKLAAFAEKYAFPVKYAPLAYITDHEQNIGGCTLRLAAGTDICFSPSCLAGLRKFLEKEYHELGALNASWHTDFKTWEEITPITLPDALETGQISRWVDHRRHMDRMWTDFTKFKIECMRKFDPNALGMADALRVGPTTLDSFSGVDYWLLMNEIVAGAAMPMPYLASFVPEQRKHLVWRRGAAWHPDCWTADPALLKVRFGNQPWQALLAGANGYTYWAYTWGGSPDGNFAGPVMMDLTSTDFGRYPAEQVAQIRSGIYRLLHEARRDHSGIALHFSRSSEHVCTAWQAMHDTPVAKQLDPPAARFGFLAPVLKAVQRQFRAVSYGQIEQGMLRQGRFKLLLLPFSQALSPLEARAIRDFVRAGGCVLADIRPGMTDHHGSAAERGLLDDVFGVKHRTALSAYEPKKGTVRIQGMLADAALNVALKGVLLGPNAELAGARALGRADDAPALIVNEYGKGKAILLNFSMRSLALRHEAVRELFEQLLDFCGIDRLFRLDVLDEVWETNRGEQVRLRPEDFVAAVPRPGVGLGEQTKLAEEVELDPPHSLAPTPARFVNGDIECFGFYYDRSGGTGTRRVSITPSKPGHVYDLKTNDYLGKVAGFEATLPLAGAAVYAVVPYRIERPELSCDAAALSDGLWRVDCQVQVRPPQAGAQRHVIRFRLFAPDGAEWRDFAVSAVAEQGTAGHRFVLPVNAPRGEWKVTAREAISGLSSQTTTELRWPSP